MLKTLYTRFLLWLIRPALIQWADSGGVHKPARAAVLNDLHPNGDIARHLRAFRQVEARLPARLVADPKIKEILARHGRRAAP